MRNVPLCIAVHPSALRYTVVPPKEKGRAGGNPDHCPAGGQEGIKWNDKQGVCGTFNLTTLQVCNSATQRVVFAEHEVPKGATV